MDTAEDLHADVGVFLHLTLVSEAQSLWTLPSCVRVGMYR